MASPTLSSSQAGRVADAELRQLRGRLAATRRRLVTTQAGAGLAAALIVLVGGFAAEMTLDWLVHLPWLARACLTLPALGGAGWILYKEFLLPIWRKPSDHTVACVIERAMPVFKSRLIVSIQLAEDSVAKTNLLVGAVIRQTAALAAAQDFRKAVKTGRLIKRLRVLACVLVAATGLAWLGRANAVLLLERALLLTTRLPTRTQIVKIDCAAKIASGEDLKIDVQAVGLIPQAGVVIAEAGSKRSEYKLERDPATAGLFHAVIRSVPDSLSFSVRLNDATSDPVSVTVFQPPAVLGIKALQDFPAYTKLAPLPRPTGDLSLLAGSVLHLTVTASEPVKEGSLRLAGLEKDIPLKADPVNRALAHADIPIPKGKLTGFSIKLIDDNGINSRDPAVYPIDIIPDRSPTIKLTHPTGDVAATATATEVVAFEAEDDFGVAAVLIHYVVNQNKEKVIQFDLNGDNPRQIQRRFDWKLTPLKLAPGGSVEYWIEAVDANNVTGPGRGETEHAHLKIVTEEEKRAELSGMTNDALNSLDEVSQGEDDLAKTLGTKIFQKTEVKQP